MERKRKEREVELNEIESKEEKIVDVNSTTISTITPAELSKEITSGPVVENSLGPDIENSSKSVLETSPKSVTIETSSKSPIETSLDNTK